MSIVDLKLLCLKEFRKANKNTNINPLLSNKYSQENKQAAKLPLK